MKMNPDEARLIRDCVEQRAKRAQHLATTRDPVEKRTGEEKRAFAAEAVKLQTILEKM